jgi:hypothetical protein
MVTTWNIPAAPFYVLFGATLSFHFVATIHYIQLEQPDLRRYGYFASLVFVFTWSLLILTILLRILFIEIQLAEYYETCLRESIRLYMRAYSIFGRFFP